MWPKRKVEPIKLPELAADGSNKSDFWCADVLGNKKFAQNYGGYPRSDVALINEQNDLAVAQRMLNDMQDFRTDVNPDAGRSDIELILSQRSRYCQSAAESIRYIESELARRDAVRRAESQKAPSENSVDFKKSDSEIVDNV